MRSPSVTVPIKSNARLPVRKEFLGFDNRLTNEEFTREGFKLPE
ncbi:MAG: hypothetical protein RBR67_11345 [Desulfobacterium sp.]|nr:hypothetical protein [Desulfobacterium sp.]